MAVKDVVRASDVRHAGGMVAIWRSITGGGCP